MKTVLLGDMAASLAKELRENLERGFHVIAMPEGQTVAACLEREQPDVLILDSERGGYEDLETLGTRLDQFQLVMLVPTEPPIAEQLRQANRGVNAFVAKYERRLFSRRPRPVRMLGVQVYGALIIPEDRRDPQEDDPILGPVIQAAGQLARAMVGRSGRGTCHSVWREKKRILREEHGIEWKTPQEMNPGSRFD